MSMAAPDSPSSLQVATHEGSSSAVVSASGLLRHGDRAHDQHSCEALRRTCTDGCSSARWQLKRMALYFLPLKSHNLLMTLSEEEESMSEGEMECLASN